MIKNKISYRINYDITKLITMKSNVQNYKVKINRFEHSTIKSLKNINHYLLDMHHHLMLWNRMNNEENTINVNQPVYGRRTRLVKLWKLFKFIEYQLLATLILIDGSIWNSVDVACTQPIIMILRIITEMFRPFSIFKFSHPPLPSHHIQLQKLHSIIKLQQTFKITRKIC